MAKRKKSSPKDKLDKLFSEYVRRSAADDRGYVKCVTCGKVAHWKDGMQAGHYVPRNHLAIRYDETNVHVQCVGCNVFKKGNMDAYALFMLRTYGREKLEELERKKHEITKNFDYEGTINEYKEKLTELPDLPERA